MLFRAPPDFKSVFDQTARDAGFKSSDGKDYVSLRKAMINSQVFSLRQEKKEIVISRDLRVLKLQQWVSSNSSGKKDWYLSRSEERLLKKGIVSTWSSIVKTVNHVRRIGYLNLKMVMGISLKTGVSKATPTMLAKDIQKMIDLCPWTACSVPETFSRFRKDWRSKFITPNWYMPVHLGGYGLRPPSLRELKVTRQQRKVAAMFINDPTLALYQVKGFVLKTKGMENALSNFQMIPSSLSTVIQHHQDYSDSDKWLERLALWSNYREMGKSFDDVDAFVCRRLMNSTEKFRLKPASIDKIVEYENVRFIGTRVPDCPPLNLLSFPRILGERFESFFSSVFRTMESFEISSY
jgi:hypothetical protein